MSAGIRDIAFQGPQDLARLYRVSSSVPRALFGLLPSLSFLSSVIRPPPPSLFPSSLLFWIFLSASERLERNARPSSSSSLCFFFLVFSRPYVLCLALIFLSYAMLFHAWLTTGNRRSYRDYVHLECTHHRPSAPLLEASLFFSLRDAVKSFLAQGFSSKRRVKNRHQRFVCYRLDYARSNRKVRFSSMFKVKLTTCSLEKKFKLKNRNRNLIEAVEVIFGKDVTSFCFTADSFCLVC